MTGKTTHHAGAVSAPLARILVVDDDQAARRVLQRALTGAGYHVEVAQDGFEALAMLPLGADLVLVDAVMPGLDGFEVARRIRSDPAQRDLPILMVTGMDSARDRVRAAEAGVTGFLAKPYELTVLKAQCASLLLAGKALARATPPVPARGGR